MSGAPPAPTPASPHSRLLRFAVGLSVVAGALIAVVLVGGALVTLLASTSDAVERRARTFPALERLRIDAGAGDVTVVGERRDDIRVVTRTHRNMWHDDREPTVALRGGLLRLDGGCSLWTFLGSRECVAFTVRVPRSLAISVVGGGAGDVRLEQLAGPVAVATGSGDVEVDGYRGTAVSATTQSGDVEVRTLRAPRRIDAQAGSGDVEIVVPDRPYRVDVATGSGDRDVQVADDPRAGRSIRVRTGSGDVGVLGLGAGG